MGPSKFLPIGLWSADGRNWVPYSVPRVSIYLRLQDFCNLCSRFFYEQITKNLGKLAGFNGRPEVVNRVLPKQK